MRNTTKSFVNQSNLISLEQCNNKLDAAKNRILKGLYVNLVNEKVISCLSIKRANNGEKNNSIKKLSSLSKMLMYCCFRRIRWGLF